MASHFNLWLSFAIVFLCMFDTKAISLGQDQLPSAEEIFERSAKAVGSAEAWKGITTLICKGKAYIPPVDPEYKVEILKSSDGKMRLNLSVSSSNYALVTDGTTVWRGEERDMQVVEGVEAMIYRSFAPISLVHEPKRYFDKTRVNGRTKFEDEQCLEVECQKGNETPILFYFSIESGLEVGRVFTTTTGNVTQDSTVLYLNYKEVDGLKLPHKFKFQFPEGDQILELESIVTNKAIAPKVFKVR